MDVLRIIGAYLYNLRSDLLRRAPYPDDFADAGDQFKTNRHRFRARPSAMKDMAEKVGRDFRPESNLFLGNPFFRCTHGQLFGE